MPAVAAPSAVLGIFPAGPVGALPPRPLPARAQVEIFVGDADTSGHARRRYVVVRSRPGFVANHDSAQRSKAIARAVFWAPLDRLITQARH